MAHNLATTDGRAAMMYRKADGVPWHGLGTPVEGAQTAQEAIKAAGLDWTVSERPIMAFKTSEAEANGDASALAGWKALFRSDSGNLLHVARETYTPVQNSAAFDFFDSVVGTGDAKYITAGALGAGERVWILAEAAACRVTVAGEEIKPYLLLSNSHDGSGALRMLFTPTRVVCQNTLNAALSNLDGVALRHTSGIEARSTEARRALGLCLKFYDSFQTDANALASRQITAAALQTYYSTLIPDNDAAENKARTQNIRGRLEHLFRYGKGNSAPAVRGTWWAAYNGVTEYADHERSTRTTGNSDAADRLESRARSLLFGAGATLKSRALTLALSTVKATA